MYANFWLFFLYDLYLLFMLDKFNDIQAFGLMLDLVTPRTVSRFETSQEKKKKEILL